MPRSKKVVDPKNTVTFTKDELIKKVKQFLDDEGACDGDWLNKVKVSFLGQTTKAVDVEAWVKVTYHMDIATDSVPTIEEVTAAIQHDLDEGDFGGWDVDEGDFKVEKVTVVK